MRHCWLKSCTMLHPVTASSSTAETAKTTLSRLIFQNVSVGMGITEHSDSRAPRIRAGAHVLAIQVQHRLKSGGDYKEGFERTQARRLKRKPLGFPKLARVGSAVRPTGFDYCSS